MLMRKLFFWNSLRCHQIHDGTLGDIMYLIVSYIIMYYTCQDNYQSKHFFYFLHTLLLLKNQSISSQKASRQVFEELYLVSI